MLKASTFSDINTALGLHYRTAMRAGKGHWEALEIARQEVAREVERGIQTWANHIMQEHTRERVSRQFPAVETGVAVAG